MKNLTTWRFEGTQTSYQSPAESLETAINKMRKALGLSPKIKIEILNDGSIEQSTNDANNSDSDEHTDQHETLSTDPKPTKSKRTSSKLRTLPSDLDNPIS